MWLGAESKWLISIHVDSSQLQPDSRLIWSYFYHHLNAPISQLGASARALSEAMRPQFHFYLFPVNFAHPTVSNHWFPQWDWSINQDFEDGCGLTQES